MKILVTGAAGFIGFSTCKELLKRGDEVVGIDNINNYYDVRLKYGRLAELGIEVSEIEWNKIINSFKYKKFSFIKMNLENREMLPRLFAEKKFDKVINLAAQAGVRYSIENPFAYIDSNIVGFINILECCRHNEIKHLVYASSSSVYGGNVKIPFEEIDIVDSPVSLYAATKRSNELMAFCYSKLYNLRITGLRYFTVYGPWGRPDMAPMLFSEAILTGKPIKIFNNGNLSRDFTYIDDIVEGSLRVLDFISTSGGQSHEVYNIGCGKPVQLLEFINILEEVLGEKAKKIYLPMQQGDVFQTYANTSKLENCVGYKPKVCLREGLEAMVMWYKSVNNPIRGE